MQFLSLPKLAGQSGGVASRVPRRAAGCEMALIPVSGRLMLPEHATGEFVAMSLNSSREEAEVEVVARCQRGIKAEVEGDAV